ncbi:ribulokinase [Microbacterium tumbae]
MTLVAGVDYGSDSVRVGVVDVSTGRTVLSVSRAYPRWAAGLYCSPADHRFRQHPLDYIETLEACFAEIADALGDGAIAALAVDATGSTPAPVDAAGIPLALHPEFAEDPDGMFWLWKDRSAVEEATRIQQVLESADPDFTQYQGVYSSEWWWAKILRATTINERVRIRAVSWLEHADWLPNMLIGADDVTRFGRNACAAGHKALYNEHFGGAIPAEVLGRLSPVLAAVRDTMRVPPMPAGTALGTLSVEWAARLRMSTDTVVGVGSLDAHAGGVGAGIDSRSMVKVMGTSTVDLFLTDYEAIEGRDLHRLCGIAENSIIPGALGGETSQAAFGDLFAWFARMLAWPVDNIVVPRVRAERGAVEAEALRADMWGSLLSALEREAVQREDDTIIALDWINGRRYPDVDEDASAALTGLRIGHDAVDVYRSLVRAAVLGSKAIHDGLAGQGLVFDRVILVGGIAKKSPFICQSMADALNTEVLVSEEDEVCAIGSAMYAATALGAFSSLVEAQRAIAGGFEASYQPDPDGVARYADAFEAYQHVGMLLGTEDR